MNEFVPNREQMMPWGGRDDARDTSPARSQAEHAVPPRDDESGTPPHGDEMR